MITVKTIDYEDMIEYDFYQNNKKLDVFSAGILLSNNKSFRNLCTGILQNVPYAAYYVYFGVIYFGHDTDFKICVSDAPGLELVMANNVYKVKKEIDEIKNLTSDCLLVVPKHTKGTDRQIYTHIGSFIRFASAKQIEELWITIGNRIQFFGSGRIRIPIWISTHGHGVSWLHVRFDSSPKYLHWVPDLQEFKKKQDRQLMIEFLNKCF